MTRLRLRCVNWFSFFSTMETPATVTNTAKPAPLSQATEKTLLGKDANPGLCGGRRATNISTATHLPHLSRSRYRLPRRILNQATRRLLLKLLFDSTVLRFRRLRWFVSIYIKAREEAAGCGHIRFVLITEVGI